MKPENIQFCEENYHLWLCLRDSQYLPGLNYIQREGMIRVMREEFIPNYNPDLWCTSCVVDMVKQLFTRFDAWKAANPPAPEPQPEPEPQQPEQAADPIKVEASFPKHDQPKKKNHPRR